MDCRKIFFFIHQKMESALKDVTAKFQAPRKMEISIDSLSSTEEVDADMEEIIRQEAKDWLSMHASKLFNLEVSKYLATQEKRKNVRAIR